MILRQMVKHPPTPPARTANATLAGDLSSTIRRDPVG